MQFDPENRINKLCAQGMLLEGEGKPAEAAKLFRQAWHEATNDMERFTAAHYVARHQPDAAGKLEWDETALAIALGIEGDAIKATYPSLYLNVAKCYEDLNDPGKAREYYQLAYQFTEFLPDDGYGSMIKRGIAEGMERVR